MRPVRVAVLGMDGAGKTTLIGHAVSQPSPLRIGSAYLGHNQFTTQTFRWLLARIEARKANHRADSLSVKLLDKGRALLWPLELYARIRRAERGRAVVFCDRYPFPSYDRDDRPTTLPGHIMAAYERLWNALLRRPDLLLFLDGAPEVIWARKREYPFETFQRGRARCLQLVEGFPGERHVIATDGPLAVSTFAVTEMLRTSAAVRRRLYRRGPAKEVVDP